MTRIERAAVGLVLTLVAAGAAAASAAAPSAPEAGTSDTPQAEAASAPAAPPPAGGVREARDLATHGQRAEALEMLERRLAAAPDDNEARTLYGTVLSWEGRYDDARRELTRVLDRRRDHGDALPALLNLEIWSGHPERAESLARDALARKPDDPRLLLGLARALKAQGRREEAQQIVERVRGLEPDNREAERLRRSLAGPYDWYVGFGYAYDHFTDGSEDWRESRLELKHQFPKGSVIGRFSHAERFGAQDEQYEVDAYPSFRPGTYAYLNVGFAPGADLYPKNRVGAELFQRLGHGFEGSLGFRWLKFTDSVNIYTASVSKYFGNWLYTVRTYVTPDSIGTSASYHATARYYFGAETYVGLRYAAGSSRDEIRSTNDTAVLDSHVIEGQGNVLVTPRLELTLRVGHSTEERIFGDEQKRNYATGRVAFRF